MNLKPSLVLSVYQQSIEDWHKNNTNSKNPYKDGSLESILYNKNQIDTTQWHVEDEIRRPDIPDSETARLKREIDKLNQERTNLVETLDDYFFRFYQGIKKEENAKMNSETPAWLIDRMSILELKIYHMKEQTERKDVDEEHINSCLQKLKILVEQRQDLSVCLEELFDDLQSGKKYMKVYRQMKMYNDNKLNPALYDRNKK